MGRVRSRSSVGNRPSRVAGLASQKVADQLGRGVRLGTGYCSVCGMRFLASGISLASGAVGFLRLNVRGPLMVDVRG